MPQRLHKVSGMVTPTPTARVKAKAIQLQDEIMINCFEGTCDYDYDRFVEMLRSALSTLEAQTVERAAQVADERGRIMNICGSDSNNKFKGHNYDLQAERVFEAQTIATAIRGLLEEKP